MFFKSFTSFFFFRNFVQKRFAALLGYFVTSNFSDFRVDIVFANHPTCRLINPAKSELGKVSKQILDNINSKIRKMTKLNQWKIISDVIYWFTNIPDLQKHSFTSFDINSFYPSITESFVSKAISFAKNYTTISDKDIDIIMHCRKSLLFDNETAWTKKNHSSMFDVTMGSFDGAEVCELIGFSS